MSKHHLINSGIHELILVYVCSFVYLFIFILAAMDLHGGRVRRFSSCSVWA